MSGLSLPHAHKFPTRIAIRVAIALLLLALAWLVRGLMVSAPVTPVLPPATAWNATDAIALYQARLRANSDDVEAYTMLGMALLQQVRETGDPSAYTRAETAFNQAIQRQPDLYDALVGQGMLALSRHDFRAALTWAEKAHRANPYRPDSWGIYTDAYVELGRYDEAIVAAQEMVDMRPGLASYTRVSYVRELHGNIDGAIAAMRAAVGTGLPGSEQSLWSTVQLGNLYFNRGDLTTAESLYTDALSFREDYVYALGGLARVQAARADYATAIDLYTQVTERIPLPEFLIALGDLYTITEQTQKAEEQYALVRVIQKLNEAAGMDVDMEMALFDVDHGPDALGALERAPRCVCTPFQHPRRRYAGLGALSQRQL